MEEAQALQYQVTLFCNDDSKRKGVLFDYPSTVFDSKRNLLGYFEPMVYWDKEDNEHKVYTKKYIPESNCTVIVITYSINQFVFERFGINPESDLCIATQDKLTSYTINYTTTSSASTVTDVFSVSSDNKTTRFIAFSEDHVDEIIIFNKYIYSIEVMEDNQSDLNENAANFVFNRNLLFELIENNMVNENEAMSLIEQLNVLTIKQSVFDQLFRRGFYYTNIGYQNLSDENKAKFDTLYKVYKTMIESIDNTTEVKEQVDAQLNPPMELPEVETAEEQPQEEVTEQPEEDESCKVVITDVSEPEYSNSIIEEGFEKEQKLMEDAINLIKYMKRDQLASVIARKEKYTDFEPDIAETIINLFVSYLEETGEYTELFTKSDISRDEIEDIVKKEYANFYSTIVEKDKQ